MSRFVRPPEEEEEEEDVKEFSCVRNKVLGCEFRDVQSDRLGSNLACGQGKLLEYFCLPVLEPRRLERATTSAL